MPDRGAGEAVDDTDAEFLGGPGRPLHLLGRAAIDAIRVAVAPHMRRQDRLVALVDSVADRLADEMRRDGMHREVVALELVALLGAVRGFFERPGGIEVVAPAGQLEPLVAKLARFPGEVIEGQIGPLAGEQRDRSRHGGAPDNGRCGARRIVTEGPRGGNVGWRGGVASGLRLPACGIAAGSWPESARNHVRITLRISHTPQSVTSTFPVHTASGGTAPDFACDTPNMKTG
jgi:hypothetical protein